MRKKVKKMSIESEGEDGMTPIHYVCRLLSIKKKLRLFVFPQVRSGRSRPTRRWRCRDFSLLPDSENPPGQQGGWHKEGQFQVNKVRLSFQLLFFCFLRLTPLHHLAMRGNLPMITLLLDQIKSTDSGSFGSVDATDIQVLLLLLLLPIQTHTQN